MLRCVCALVVLLVGLVATCESAFARQVALVIGTARYDQLPSLLNPKRDAAAMADRLRDLGFEVIEAFDADRADIKRATDRFVVAARGADLALFYFAGHGVQLFDRNVLVARDADPARALGIDDLGLDLTTFMARLKAVSPVRMAVMIDACRDNPLSFDATVAFMRRAGIANGQQSTGGQRTRGLAPISLERESGGTRGAASETLIFYSAEPGRVSSDGAGQNSYVVEGLLEALAKPGIAFNDALKSASAYVRTVTRGAQVPQIYSDWTGDVVLGQAEVAKVRYLNSGRARSGDLTPQELKIVGEGNRSWPALRGTFIVSERQAFVPGMRELDEAAQKRIDAIGHVNGFAIDYDLERRGRADTIAVYFRQVHVTFQVISEGVAQNTDACFRPGDAEEAESVEIALRDINGDRRPEVFVHYRAKDDPWGIFCILEYTGIAGHDAQRRAPAGVREATGAGPFRLLLRERGMNISVGQDNGIEICSGSNCHTRTRIDFDGQAFRLTMDDSETPSGARALPFRDEAERERLGAVKDSDAGAAQPTQQTPPANAPPARSSQINTAEVQRFVSEVYLDDGTRGTVLTPFADRVMYYGRWRTKAELVADKLSYYAKWPQRRYVLDPNTLRVTPSTATPGGMDLDFEYTYALSSGARRAEGRGRARLTVVRAGQGIAIVREEGEVLKR